MPHGFSADRLVRIDRFLQETYIDSGRFAGRLTLIARGGQMAHVKALGQMDYERGKPTTEATIFRFYSMTIPSLTLRLVRILRRRTAKRLAPRCPPHRTPPNRSPPHPPITALVR